MRIKIEGYKVQFYVDESSPCCGENRADWKLVGSCSVETLVKALQEVVIGRTKIKRLDV